MIVCQLANSQMAILLIQIYIYVKNVQLPLMKDVYIVKVLNVSNVRIVS